MRAYLLGLIVPALLPTVSIALDLTRIDRTIRGEPNYQSRNPRYCLAVFGPEAKTRVWLVRDGETLFADRNRNGVIGESGERIVRRNSYSSFSMEKLIPSSSTDVTNTLRVSFDSSGRARMWFYGKQRQMVGFGRHTPLHFSKKPQKAPIVHFDGPLTLGRFAEPVTLGPDPASKSYRKTSLRLMVGSAGHGPGTFAALHCRCRRDKGDLVASFAYPSAEGGTLQVKDVRLKTYG